MKNIFLVLYLLFSVACSTTSVESSSSKSEFTNFTLSEEILGNADSTIKIDIDRLKEDCIEGKLGPIENTLSGLIRKAKLDCSEKNNDLPVCHNMFAVKYSFKPKWSFYAKSLPYSCTVEASFGLNAE